MGFQLRDKGLGRVGEKEGKIHQSDGANALKPQVLGNQGVAVPIGVYTHDENIPAFGGKIQEAKVTRMDDIEISAEEDNPRIGFTKLRDLSNNIRDERIGFHHGLSVYPFINAARIENTPVLRFGAAFL